MTPIELESEHSLGLGTARVEALVARAAAWGLPALALTDRESLAGAPRHHRLAREAGLRAVTGVALRQGSGPRGPGLEVGRLVLLARDAAGYRSLCRIVSRRRAGPGAGEPPLTSLEACGGAGGLWVLTDDPHLIPGLLERAAPASAVRLLLVRPDPRVPEPALRAAARRHGVGVVADPAASLLDPQDEALRALVIALRRRVRFAEVAAGPARPLLEPARAARLFADAPGALAEARTLLEACELDLLAARPRAPTPLLRPGERADEHLAARCRAALERRGLGEPYRARVERELEAIAGLELAGLFLVLAEVLEGARGLGIPAAGRGSAAASLVCHLLGFSPVDPLAQGLLFERFLHPLRSDPPDVDLDVCSARREELLAWVARRFGPRRVARVSAHVTWGRRAAFREGLEALGLPPRELERFLAHLPPEELAQDPDAPPALVGPPPLHLLPPAVRAHAELLVRLVGLPRHLSAHPGGVVIGEGPLDELLPLERTSGGLLCTQYDLRGVAEVGLVKLDLLGNRALSALGTALRLLPPGSATRALREEGLAAIPLDDPGTARVLDQAETVGCAQVETPALRSLLRRVPVRGLPDLMAALAVVRPGPAAGQAKEAFVRRARGEEPISPLHPELAGTLAGSQGLLLYEEDITRALARVGGLSLVEADRLRAEVRDRGQDPSALTALRARFLRAAQAAGRSEAEVAPVWEAVARLAAYSFNQAHAATQALQAWRSAWFAAHFPLELGCGLLDHHGGAYPLRTIGAALVRRGVRLLPPSVDRSELGASVEEDAQGRALRIGLARVKHLRRRSAQALLAARGADGPFRDLEELLRRVPLDARELAGLVRCGACDHLAPLTPQAYPFLHEALLAGRRAGSAPGFDAHLAGRAPPAEPAARALWERYRALTRAKHELELLELHPSGHPLALLRDEAARAGCLTIAEAVARPGEAVSLAALLAASRRVVTRGGQVMRFLTLEDETGLLEAILLPPAHARTEPALTTPGPYLVHGRVVVEQDDPHLALAGLIPFHARRGAYRSWP